MATQDITKKVPMWAWLVIAGISSGASGGALGSFSSGVSREDVTRIEAKIDKLSDYMAKLDRDVARDEQAHLDFMRRFEQIELRLSHLEEERRR